MPGTILPAKVDGRFGPRLEVLQQGNGTSLDPTEIAPAFTAGASCGADKVFTIGGKGKANLVGGGIDGRTEVHRNRPIARTVLIRDPLITFAEVFSMYTTG